MDNCSKNNELTIYFNGLTEKKKKEVLKAIRLKLQIKYDPIVVSQILKQITSGNFADVNKEVLDTIDSIIDLTPIIYESDKEEDDKYIDSTMLNNNIEKDSSIPYNSKQLNIDLNQEIIRLRSDVSKYKNELEKRNRLLSIVEKNVLYQVSDDDVDNIFIECKNNPNVQNIKNAYLFSVGDQILIPKSYYLIKK